MNISFARWPTPWLAPAAWLLACAVGAVACSAALDWDPDGLACDTQVVDGRTDFCLRGYTCMTPSDTDAPGRCVRDHSLKVGDACTNSSQCAENALCPLDLLAGGGVAGVDGVKQCRPRCNDAGADPYYTASACSSGQVCLPFLDARAIDPNKALVGACLPSAACTPGSACTTPSVSAGTCVALDNGENACLTGCEITFSAAGTYSDNCDGLHSCQPVGAAGQKQFVCVYNGQNSTANPLAGIGGQSVGAAGEACSALEKTCAQGDVCAPTGVCASYCPITGNNVGCPTGQSCCKFTSFATSQTSGYCSANCL